MKKPAPPANRPARQHRRFLMLLGALLVTVAGIAPWYRRAAQVAATHPETAANVHQPTAPGPRANAGAATTVQAPMETLPVRRQTALARLAYAQEWDGPLPPEMTAFRNWTTRYLNAAAPGPRSALAAEGVTLARARKPAMLDLIKTDPRRALAVTVPATLRQQLPAPVLAELETRIAGQGDFEWLEADAAPGIPGAPHWDRRVVFLRGVDYTAHPYGRRAAQTTKENASLHGIALDGEFALHESPLRLLEPGEAPPTAIEAQDPVTGEPVSLAAGRIAPHPSRPTLVEAFDRTWILSEPANNTLTEFEQRLNAAETRPGPRVRALVLGPDGAISPSTSADDATPWTTGPKQVLVIRVDFSDKAGDPANVGPGGSVLTAQAALDWMNNTVAPFYRDMSYGKTTIVPTVSTKVYRLPQTAASYATSGNIDQLHTDAQTAASIDYPVSTFDRVIVAFGPLNALPGSLLAWGGLGIRGGTKIWLNGAFSAAAHELGHTYGVLHANLWKVADGNPISATGTSLVYGDPYDVMGGALSNDPAAHFNPVFKNELGWITDAQVLTVTASGTYRINRFDHPGATGTMALSIAKDLTHTYWVSARRAVNLIRFPTDGVFLQWRLNTAPGYPTLDTNLLDLNTPGDTPQNAALAPGQSFSDVDTGVSVSVVSQGGTSPNEYVDVRVTYGPVAPTINNAPANQTVGVGQTLALTITADGNPKPKSYQWQRLLRGSTTWTSLVDDSTYIGSATATLTVRSVSAANSGDQFRCVVANSTGSTVSSAATITVVSYGVFTLAGTPGAVGSADGVGAAAQFNSPTGLAADSAGNLYVSDSSNQTIRKITPEGAVTTLAGLAGSAGSVDGTGSAARFYTPQYVTISRDGNIYTTDYGGQTIRMITPGGQVTTVAGFYDPPPSIPGITPEGRSGSVDGTGSAARFNFPTGVAVDSGGNVFVTDGSNHTIRKITPAGVVTTFAGRAGSSGAVDGVGDAARFTFPADLAVDSADNLYVTDESFTIRKITPAGSVTTLAGLAGTPGSTDGTGAAARFGNFGGIAVDRTDNLWAVVTSSGTIRKITPAGVVTTEVGFGGSGALDGAARSAQFKAPKGIAVDGTGTIFIADTGNNTIRKYVPIPTPQLLAQPLSQTVALAGSVTFSVAVDTSVGGPEAYSYQWLKNGVNIAGATGSSYTIPSAGSANAGNYSVTINTPAGLIGSSTATLTVRNVGISTQPQSVTVNVGAVTGFSVSVLTSAGGKISYQWQKDGVDIPGATNISYTFVAKASDAGNYTVRVTYGGDSTISDVARLTINQPAVSRISNLSILTNITTANPLFTVGTVIGGAGTNGTKPVLFRAAGPSLTPLGVAGALADPRLTVFSGQTSIASNDDWAGNPTLVSVFTQVGAFAYTSTASKDSAVYSPALASGGYTVQISGPTGATGTVIAELYDATPTSTFTATTPRLVNVSVLKPINAGEILTAGFVISGPTSKQVLVRAVGPTLGAAPFNVPGVMADPRLDLFSGQTVINSNNDWGGGSALSSAFVSVGAFALSGPTSKDSALLVTLQPGNYTAQVTGVNGSAGLVLVEVYEVP